MYVPSWLMWTGFLVLGTIIVFWRAARAARPRGDYDFFSPLIGAAMIGAWLLFLVGLALGKWVF